MRGEKVMFACKVFRTEHAQIPGYPPVKDHFYVLCECVFGVLFFLCTVPPEKCQNVLY